MALAGMTGAAEGPLLRRATLFVSDIDRSRAFYEAIGFRTWLDWTGDQDPQNPSVLPLAAPATQSRIVIVAGRDDYAAMIGLLQMSEPALESNRKLADRLGINDVMLVIETDRDLDAFAGRIGQLGGSILRPPTPYTSNGPAGRKTGVSMLARDPDGYVVEVTRTTSLAPRN
jgi:catechol 2,3-dioxygenase-like lactoylglutathione lyase family enzyme